MSQNPASPQGQPLPPAQPAPAVPVVAAPVTPVTTVPVRRKHRKRRIILITLAGLLLLLIAFILLLPTILSFGIAASIANGQVNQRIRGHVNMHSVSLGWFSPIVIDNISVRGPHGTLVARATQIRTQLSLLDLLSNYHHFKTVHIDVKPVTLVTEKNGQLNLMRALASRSAAGPAAPAANPAQPAPQSSSGAPATWQGIVVCKISQLTYSRPGQPTVILNVVDGTVGVDTSGKSPTTFKLLASIINAGTPGRVALNGTARPFSNGVMRPVTNIPANVQLHVMQTPLALLNPILEKMAHPFSVSGLVNGRLNLVQHASGAGQATGSLKAAGVAAAGPALHGDTPQLGDVSIPINASWNPATIQIKTLRVINALASLGVSGTYARAATAAAAPANNSHLQLSAHLALPLLAAQLPHTLHLQKGVNLTSGVADLRATVAGSPAAQTLYATLLIKSVRGTAAGKNIQLQPLALRVKAMRNSGAMALQSAHLAMPGGSTPATQQTLWISAAPLNRGTGYKANMHCVLNAAYAQLAQFVNLKGKTASGTVDGQFQLGNPAQSPTPFSAVIAAKNLHLVGFGSHPISETAAHISLTHGTMQRSNGSISSISCTLQANTAEGVIAPSPVQLARTANGRFGGGVTLHVQTLHLAQLAAYFPPSMLKARKLALSGAIGQSIITVALAHHVARVVVALFVPQITVRSTDPKLQSAVFVQKNLRFACRVVDPFTGAAPGRISGVKLTTANNAMQVAVGKPITFSRSGGKTVAAQAQFVHAGVSLDALRPLLVACGYVKANATLHGYASIDGSGNYTAHKTFVGFLAQLNGYQYSTPQMVQKLPPTNLVAKGSGWYVPAKKQFTATSPVDISEHAAQGPGSDSIALAKGSVLAGSPGVPLNIHAMLTYNLARVSALLGPYLPAGVVMTGKRREAIAITGELAAGSGMAMLRPVVIAPMQIGFDKISYEGTTMGPGHVPLRMSNGVATITRTAIPANGGTLQLGGHVDFRQTPPVFILNHPLALANNVNLNGQMSAGPLEFLPLVWGARQRQAKYVRVAGLLTLHLRAARIPLNSIALKTAGTATGSVSIKKLSADTPLFATLTKLIGPFMGANGSNLALKDSGLRKTAFQLAHGKVSYKNLKLLVESYGVSFTGTAGLDKTVNMRLTVTGSKLNVPVPLALHGTMSQPKLALSANALKAGLKQLPGLLNKFHIGGKQTGKPGAKKKKNGVSSILQGLGGLLNQGK